MLESTVGKKEEIKIWQSALLSNAEIAHGFTTRAGGVSPPPFHTLNLGLTTKDLPQNVLENRKRFANQFGFALAPLAWQIHGNDVLVLKQENAIPQEPNLPKADAIISNIPKLVVSMFFADCLPIYFWDPIHHAGGIAHAGWRSTLLGISEKTVEMMQEVFGTKPDDLIVVLGPSIGPCCFEVQKDVEEPFLKRFGESVCIQKNGKTFIDLWEANKLVLKGKGVKMENVEEAKLCTSCNENLFFSYRRDKGNTGRMAGFLQINFFKGGD
jgi:YfiH family protein